MKLNATYNKTFFRVILLGVILTLTSCKKFLAIDPPKTEIVNETVFSNDGSAISAVRGIYSLMVSTQSFTNGGLELLTGLSADEFANYSTRPEQSEFDVNSLTTRNGNVLSIFWTEAYKYINNANGVLEGLQRSTNVQQSTKKQLEGEAKFIRAFCYFYLVNLFGDVPYITSTDYRINSNAGRTAKSDVYRMLTEDLLSAQSLLTSDFSFSNGNRTQPNKGAATALLARVYLYRGDWVKAEAQATSLIENTANYSLEADLNNAFLIGSSEAIWQLMPIEPGVNTAQGRYFILFDIPANVVGRVSLSTEIYNSFESGDTRKNNWVGIFSNGSDTYYYPFKYKVDYNSTIIEYAMILRLAEQYLIRAEARARQNNISAAQADLNVIRNRAGLGNTLANDEASLLLAIEQERKVELFAEGHRWLDLIRTDRANPILGALKPDWQPTDALYPIPEAERLINPSLTQNAGY